MSPPKAFTISDKTYEADMARAVDIVFERATYVCDMDWRELADAAKLSYATVYRLGSRITQLPRWQTFWKLACATGMRIQFVDREGHVVLPKTHLKVKAA